MKTTIIGEIGINHNGSLDAAKKLIDLAVLSGMDVVKFQKRNPDACVPEAQKTKPKNTPWGEMTYLEYKYRMEFGEKEYDAINEYCRNKIQWSASVWDTDSVEFMRRYVDEKDDQGNDVVPFIKIPSALLTNLELLEAAKTLGKKIVLSTGMSSLEEIDAAVDLVKNYEPGFELMVCNSAYPAKVEDLNLMCIRSFYDRYGCNIGYSGHEEKILTSCSAIYLAAANGQDTCMVERHITMDRDQWGSDHKASLAPIGCLRLCSGIRELETALGDGVKRITEAELPIREKLRG